MDQEFQVLQELPNLKTTPRVGPLAWFSNQHGQIELDSGLPIDNPYARSSKFLNVWLREYPDAFVQPFGRYRQTCASVRIRTGVLPEVVFSTRLKNDGDWQLDYYYPWAVGDSFGTWLIPENDSLVLEITQGKTTFEEPLRVRSMSHGWNKIGIYNLKEADVVVKLVYRPQRDRYTVNIYADAIRWTPTDNH